MMEEQAELKIEDGKYFLLLSGGRVIPSITLPNGSSVSIEKLFKPEPRGEDYFESMQREILCYA